MSEAPAIRHFIKFRLNFRHGLAFHHQVLHRSTGIRRITHAIFQEKGFHIVLHTVTSIIITTTAMATTMAAATISAFVYIIWSPPHTWLWTSHKREPWGSQRGYWPAWNQCSPRCRHCYRRGSHHAALGGHGWR